MKNSHRFLSRLESLLEWGGVKKDVSLLAVSAAALAASLAGFRPFSVDPAWIAVVLCGVPIVCGAVTGLVTSFDIKADVLVSLALAASLVLGEIFAAGEVALIMQLGALLEDLTVAKARAGIEKLVRLTPRTARRIGEDGRTETLVPVEQVAAGDILRVLPGETVPVDGVIVSGSTSVDQSVITGESLPADKAPGDAVDSGAVNRFGAFTMQAVKVGEDSSVQRMIRLVQSADAGKAKIVRMADRWATWIVAGALAAAALTWIFSGQILRAVTVLVVFCPCSLVLATPTAVMAAIGNSTRRGFLVREGDALERLAKVRAVAFDKTGTLTFGRLHVAAVEPAEGVSGETLFRLAASAESGSEHPLGKAVTAGWRAAHPEEKLLPVESCRILPGKGLYAVVAGSGILAGNAALFAEQNIPVPAACLRAAGESAAKGYAGIFVARDGAVIGFLALSDTLRPDAEETVACIRETGISPVLLTGDTAAAAQEIAGKVHIGEVRADCRPEDKMKFMEESAMRGSPVCMVGDGVNDAPALKKAFVGIAMGACGSDLAVEAADIALVNDEIRGLPHLLRLARRMMRVIKINLTFSMALNFAAVALAASGVLNPVTGALVHNAGSVLVIVHSALLLNWEKRPDRKIRRRPEPGKQAPFR